MAKPVRSHTLIGTARNPFQVHKTLNSTNAQVELATSDQTAITDFSLTSSNARDINDNFLELRLFAETTAVNSKCIADVYLYPNFTQVSGTALNTFAGIKQSRFEATFTSGVMSRHPITLVSSTNFGVAQSYDVSSCDNFASWAPVDVSNAVGREARFIIDTKGYTAFDVRITDVNSTDGAVNTGVVVGWRTF